MATPVPFPLPTVPPIDPVQQLALGAGAQNIGQASYTRPFQMPALGPGTAIRPPFPPQSPFGPTTTPVNIRPNLNLLQRGGSVGVSNPFAGVPNPAGVGVRPGSFAPTLASQAATKGNILSRLGSGLKPGFGKANIGAGIAAPLLGGFLGEQAGGSESILGRFLQGAGTGAGFGAFLGPKGAAIGGVIAGVGNALFGGGDEKVDFEEQLTTVLDQGGFSNDDSIQLKLMYRILKETKGEDAAKAEIGDIVINDMKMRAQAQLATEDAQSRMLATQALTAQFFQPFTQQLLDSAQQRYSVTEQLANDLPPEYRSIARAQNVASLDNATRVANAYASQAQLIPQMAVLEQQQGIASQLAQQQAAQVTAQLGYGGASAGGGGSLVDVIAQQAMTGP